MRRRMCRLAAFALMALTARAAPAQSLGLTPAEIRAAFRPQQVLQFELHVSNEGDAPVAMRGSVTDLWFDPATNEKVFAAPGTLPRSAANWVTFVPATFTVAAHATATVKALITPPPEATGGAYAALFRVETRGDTRSVFAGASRVRQCAPRCAAVIECEWNRRLPDRRHRHGADAAGRASQPRTIFSASQRRQHAHFP